MDLDLHSNSIPRRWPESVGVIGAAQRQPRVELRDAAVAGVRDEQLLAGRVVDDVARDVGHARLDRQLHLLRRPRTGPVDAAQHSARGRGAHGGEVGRGVLVDLGVLADLPTAFYITAVEIPKATIVGQFQPETGEQEEFGMLFQKGSPLVDCVNQALTILRDDGTLASIESRWLSDVVGVPELTP